MSKRLILVIPLVAVVLSCGTTDTTYVKDGTDYSAVEGVFRGRWWSYYERGVNLMRGGFYEAAAADFRKAIDGRSRDSWQARTYGLHFVEYFPNRELAVALQKLGRFEESQMYLERSLKRIDTARAHHYLDLAKREQIARGSMTDKSAPSLSINLDDRILTADLDVAMQISSTDDTGVEVMTVNGEELYQRGSAEAISYESTVSFGEGTHQITIEATDLADKVTTVTREVTVDLTGPTVGIREPEAALITEASSVRLIGTTVDVNGLDTIRLDDRVLEEATTGQNRLGFDTALPLQDGENTFVLMASDRAGNETRTAINVYKGSRETTAAKLWLIEQKFPEHLQLASTSPASLSLVLEALEAAEADEDVRIILKSPKADRPWRNDRAVRVAGEVIANTRVAKLEINGVTVQQLTGEPRESFNKRVVLDRDLFDADGKATIEVTVVAEDDAQHTAQERVDVSIEPIILETTESKMKLAVLTFGGETETSSLPNDLRTMTESVISQEERFGMLEREELARILSEQQLSDELGDRNSALQLGKLIPAHVFILADVIERTPEAELHVRVVSTETGLQVTPVLDAHIENTTSIDSLRKGCRNLIEELMARFPRLSGEIISVRNSKILVNWGTDDGVRIGMRLLVVVPGEPWIDEDTGEILEEGEATPIGEAAITRVTSSTTTAEKVQREGQEDQTFEKGMPVVSM